MIPIDTRFWNRILIGDLCWEFQGALENGYGRVSRNRKRIMAHIHAYQDYYQVEIPSGLIVRHKCDNRRCVRPSHLELGTFADNTRDMMERGRHSSVTKPESIPWGEQHWNTKINEKAILEVQRLANLGIPQWKIGEQVGCSQSNISRILSGDKRAKQRSELGRSAQR